MRYWRGGAMKRAAAVRAAMESLERRLLLHGLKPDGTPIDDGGGADDNPAGSIVVSDNADGTSYVSTYAPDARAVAGPASSSPWTTGNKTVLFIRATYADQPASDPESAAQAAGVMGTVNQFILDNSFGQASLTTTVTDLIVLPQPLSYYNVAGGDFTLRADALAAAKSANPAWDSSLYDFDAVRFDGGPGSYSGQAYVGQRGVWLKNSTAGVAEHEFGHNFGNWHANAWAPADPQTIIGPGTNLEYGDPFDVMGPAEGGAQHFNIYYKWALGWVPDADVTHVAASGTYTVSAADLGGTLTPGANYGLSIHKDAGRDYWLGFRQNAGWDSNPWISNGLEVLWSPFSESAGSSNGGTELLDTTPNSPGGRNDAPLVIGRTFNDDVAGIHVTPIAKHPAVGGGLPTMDVVVNFDNAATDAAPTGTMSATGALKVAAGTAVSFTSTASDPDGDVLAYSWDFGDESFGPNAAAVSHAWSTPGQYRVRLTVSDMKGKSFSRSVVVTVGSPASANTISGRVVDALGNPISDVCVYVGLGAADPNYRYGYTDSDGTYMLTNVPAGSYVMAASKAGWNLARADFLNPVLVAGTAAAVRSVDFTASQQLYKITGKVTLDGNTQVAGALVSDGIHTEPTDPLGVYTLYEPLGSYALTVTKPGAPWTFNNASATVQFADVTNANVTATGAYIIGSIEDLPPGVTVTISDGFQTITTSASPQQGGLGYWSLGPVPIGTWQIAATAPGYTFTPIGGWTNPLTVNGPASNLNFVAAPAAVYSIRGRVTDREQGLAGATVTAFNPTYGLLTTATDSYGTYRFTDLASATYELSASMAGYAFAQANVPVTVSDADAAGPALATTNFNAPPTVAIAAAGPATVTAASTPLAVLGADDAGEAYLKYTWSDVSAPAGGTVTFAMNASNSAKDTIATFNAPGTYVLRATMTDPGNISVTSDVTLNVVSAAAFASVTPQGAALYPGARQQLAATMYDQFIAPLAAQPVWTWTVSGARNTISAGGLLTTGTAGGPFTVTASSGGISATGVVTVIFASVVGRGVFYNNSGFDGGDPAPNAADDAAIAPDKAALLPGQTATFANYTTFFRGINGVIIDVKGLENAAGLTAADFTLAAGTSATPGSWTAAPAPAAVTVRGGAGIGGADRIEFAWADGAIVNTWLQVTLKADTNTGMAAPDVFYFGNLVGDANGNGMVSAADIAFTKFVQGQAAAITSAADFNRSGQITGADVGVVKAGQGATLPMLAAPAVAAAAAPAVSIGFIAAAPAAVAVASVRETSASSGHAAVPPQRSATGFVPPPRPAEAAVRRRKNELLD